MKSPARQRDGRAGRNGHQTTGPRWQTTRSWQAGRRRQQVRGPGDDRDSELPDLLACHLVVADATAQFALSEVKVGLAAGAGGLVRLPRAIPPKVATEMILTGRRITAEEALGYGLVNRVVDAGTALDGARALAAEILDGSPTSVRISLQVMEETRGIPDVIDAVTHPTTAFDDLMASDDAIEGLTAFAQKRRPGWRNR